MKYLFLILASSFFSLHAQIHWEPSSTISAYVPEDFVLDKKGNLYLSIKGNDLIYQTNIFDQPLKYNKLPKVSTKKFYYDLNPISLFLDFNDTLLAFRGAIPYRFFGTYFAKDSVGRIDTNYSSMSTSLFMKYNLEGDLFGSFLDAIFQYKDKWKNDRNNIVFDGSTVFNYFPFDEENNYAMVGGNSYRVIKYNSKTLERTPVFETNTPMDYRSLTVTADGHIFAGTSAGLYHSYNDGKEFEVILIDTTLGHTSIARVFQTKSGDAIIAQVSSGFFASYDKGKSWVKLYIFNQNAPTYYSDIWEKLEMIDTANAALMIRNSCITYQSFLLSPDQGEWVKMDPPAFKMNAFNLFKNKKNRLFSHDDGCEWIYSDDEGDEWHSLLNNGGAIQNLAMDSKDQLYSFNPFNADSKVLYWSKDNGHSWDTNHVFDHRILSIQVFTDGSMMLFASPPSSLDPSLFYYSNDHGESWVLQNKGVGLSGQINQMLKGPDGSIYAFLTNGRDAMISRDLGKTWQVDDRLKGIRFGADKFFDINGYFVFQGTINGVRSIYRSLDLNSFENITINGPSLHERMHSIAPGVIVGAFNKAGIQITYDYGQNWTDITADLDFDITNRSYSANSILIDDNGRIFLARAYDGIYRTNTMAVAVEDPHVHQNTFFSFGPNPTEGFLNFRLNETITSLNTELELSNSLGQCLLKKKNITQTEVLDLRNFAPGIYYLSVKTVEGIMQTEKIIKQ